MQSSVRRALALCSASLTALAAQAVLAAEVAPLQVVATPLGGREPFGAPLQSADSEATARSNAPDLTSFLSRRLGGVYVNEVQNNPLQPDVNYRGYTASPLLGTPQGLSVYLDGVRLNQPFGDVVSWDLIPRAALREVSLTPGSNPLFGLNSLGGALTITTKDGLSAAGTALQASGGSYGRYQLEAETGGGTGAFDWYLTANRFREDGWRDASPSEATQAFGKLGWTGPKTRLWLSGAYAYTDLTGNGLQELRLLQRDYDSIYTKPDNTRNLAHALTARAEHRLSDGVSFSGVAYWRSIRTRTLNGDINEESLQEAVYQPSADERATLARAGYAGFPLSGETAANTPFPSWRCIANALTNAEPNEKCNGVLHRTATRQTNAGLSGQLTFAADVGGFGNSLMIGAAFDDNRADFSQTAQFGYLAPDRGVVGVPAFADGTQDSEDADDARVDLTGRTRTLSVYAADVLALTDWLSLTVAARYDRTRVRNRDALRPGGGSGSLDGDHSFDRLNPAVSADVIVSEQVSAYASYTRASRAPSAIELGCADPANPCRLPNALAGDPPLKAVTADTAEAGLRGWLGDLRWSAGVYRSVNRDDILFVADDQAGFGYFKNFGKTRRQGVELGLEGEVGPFGFGLRYDLLDATFRSEERLNGAANSSNEGPGPGFEGEIDVGPGDCLPLTPHHIFKANARWQVMPTLALEADMVALSGVYARGNENNAHAPDGFYYLGEGKTDGYAVFNAGASWTPLPGVRLFVQVANLFDKKYATAAQLGAAGFTAEGAYLARPFAGPVIEGGRPLVNSTFLAPGAPRTVWAGLRYSFGQ